MRVNLKEERKVKYRCRVCGYIYDPEKGDDVNLVSPGTEFIDLPDTWKCPICSYPKKEFRAIKG